jgi:hypothetical protein
MPSIFRYMQMQMQMQMHQKQMHQKQMQKFSNQKTNMSSTIREDYGKGHTWIIAPSVIQGEGVHAIRYIPQGDLIGVAIVHILSIVPNVTYFGSKINHSYTPNSVLRYDYSTGTHNIYAIKAIHPGVEITADYRFTPSYIMGPLDHYK